MGESGRYRQEVFDPVAHFSCEKLVAFFRLLAAGYINEDAEHDPANHSHVRSLPSGRYPSNNGSDHDAKINLIKAREPPGGKECCSHSIPVGGMNACGKVFKSNDIRKGNIPKRIAAVIHRQRVVVDVPRPQRNSSGVNRKPKLRFIPHSLSFRHNWLQGERFADSDLNGPVTCGTRVDQSALAIRPILYTVKKYWLVADGTKKWGGYHTIILLQPRTWLER